MSKGDKSPRAETWISVDTETSGGSPGVASLLSIGACVVGRPEEAFYVEITPVPGMGWSEGAEKVHGLSREHLAAHGRDPHEAMRAFADWLAALPSVVAGARPIFCGFNAPFDWMFVADYFWRFYGSCPFGISGLCQKSLYLGLTYPRSSSWGETPKSVIFGRNPGLTGGPHTHNALDDAREQAELLTALLERAKQGTLR
jgi:DNA polymerase III epsilon subunit-like protein